jgi:hypothetical protein
MSVPRSESENGKMSNQFPNNVAYVEVLLAESCKFGTLEKASDGKYSRIVSVCNKIDSPEKVFCENRFQREK